MDRTGLFWQLAAWATTIVATSARSVLAHRKAGAIDCTGLRTWAPGIAVGALAGVSIVAPFPIAVAPDTVQKALGW